MRIGVVGRGLIGAAAARHLALAGAEVLLIGPDEPADFARHPGVFASHYDEGRIFRRIDPDPFWAAVAACSIDRYDEIAQAGGTAFATPTGALLAGPEGVAFLRDTRDGAAAAGACIEVLDPHALARRFPYFAFPPGTGAVLEPAGGHLSPRRLVAAQTAAAAALGARVIRAEVRRVETGPRDARIDTATEALRVDRVLIAAGGFTNALLPRPLPLTVYARTVAFFETDAPGASHPALPALIDATEPQRPYLLPPIRYPDGRWYLKLGGDRIDVTLGDAGAAAAWFRGGGSAAVREDLAAFLRVRMPGLRPRSITHAPCVTTFSPSDRPIIDRLDGGLYVATAGCGRAAKSSDELGRLAAAAVLGRDEPLLEQTRAPGAAGTPR